MNRSGLHSEEKATGENKKKRLKLLQKSLNVHYNVLVCGFAVVEYDHEQ